MRFLTLIPCLIHLPTIVFSDISPNPNPYYVIAEDGNIQGPLYLKGSIEGAYEEDENGYTVIPDHKKSYFYARYNATSGDIVMTNLPIRKKLNGTLVGSSPLNNRLSRHARPSEDFRKHKCGEICEMKENEKRGYGRELRNLVSTTGSLKNLVVLMKFSNHINRVLPSVSDITKLMNHAGDGVTVAYDSLAPTGSVREHYLKSSYGKLCIDSTVTNWVTIDYTESFCASSFSTCLVNALSKVDSQVNFTQFDTDSDKWIDGIAFLHSGYGGEFGGYDADGTYYTSRIWSHKSAISAWTSAEGVRVSAYHISPSIWGTTGSSIGRIGVIAHETGHYLGIPDLYDTNGGGSGLGAWSLMAYSWGFDNSQYYPPPMDAWCKIALGWVTPTVITPSSQSNTLGPQCETSTIFKITTNFPAGEYLLIENRQKSCLYDSKMDGSYTGGLAIYHIDENQQSWNMEGYPGQTGWPSNGNHYRIALLQSDRLYELEKGTWVGNSGDLFHAGDTLGPSTSSTGPFPNTDSYAYGQTVKSTGISITNIAASGNNMSFLFTAGSTYTSFSPPVFRSSKTGAIRSLLGRCIDVNAANFVSGVQLQVWDCNGSTAQKWSRPNATDLRLRTSNNLCMDASGSNGTVILTTCKTSRNSQKWIHDGRNLRPMSNSGLCLNISGGTSANGAKLVISSCSNRPSSAWVEYSLSSPSGASISGDTLAHLVCPVGSKVTKIYGRGGFWVDQLVMKCDDGKTVLGPVGGTGGEEVTSSDCNSGYSSVSVTSGTYVGQVIATCSGFPSLSTTIGAALSSGSGPTTISDFQGNQRVIGMHINSELYVNRLALIYG